MIVRPKIQAQVGTKEYLLEEQAIYDKAIEQHDWTTVWECLYNATNRYLMWRLKKRDFKKTAAMDDKIVSILLDVIKKMQSGAYRINSLKYCSYFALKVENFYTKKQEAFENSFLSIYNIRVKGEKHGIYLKHIPADEK